MVTDTIRPGKGWFSARLRMVGLLSDNTMSDFYMDTVVIFTASGFRNAFERALTLGRSNEQEYETGRGKDLKAAT